MAATVKCPTCLAQTPVDSPRCVHCNQPVPASIRGERKDELGELEQPAEKWWEMEWKWIGIGLIVILGLQTGLDLLLAFRVWALLGVGAALTYWLMLGGWALLYFLGGLIIGRASPGYTVKETVFAAVGAFALNRGAELAIYRATLEWWEILVGLIMCMLFAMLGGSAGESLQQASARAKRARQPRAS